MNAAPPALFRERRFSAQDGLSLYYREYGDPNASRTPLLCLGGLTRNSKDFHRIAARLSSDRRVLCPDLRGRGRSDYDPDPGNYRPGVYVSDIVHLMAVANAHRIVVLGTSLGGLIATGLALARPAALAGIIINDIGPDLPRAGVGRIAEYVGTALSFETWDEAVVAYRERYGAAYLDLAESQWIDLAKDTFDQGDDGRIRSDYDVAIAQSFGGGVPLPDLWAMFRAVRNIPVLAIRGAVSDLLSVETFDRMAVEKPDLIRVTVANRGHAPQLDEPEAAQAIDAFLAQF